MLLTLAWKNLWRNKTRTAITMAAVFFAVLLSVFASSLKTGIFDNLIKNVVSFYTGYIQVHQSGYWDEQVLDNGMAFNETVRTKILEVPGISGVSPRLETFGLIATGENTRGCMVVGVDPEQEHVVTALRNKLKAGQYLSSDDREVLLAQGLSERLRAGTGDTVFLIGQGYHGSTAAGRFRVKGILKFGSPQLNNQVIYLSYPAARELYSAENLATSAVISLQQPSAMQQTAENLQKKLGPDYEVMRWDELMPDVKQHIETDTNNMQYVQGILYMLVSFGIFGTLLMMMVERRYELGMLVAIGMKKWKLCLLMVIESVLTVLGGCLFGLLLSIPVVFYFNRYPMRIGGEFGAVYERFGFEAIFPTSMHPEIFINQGITVLLIGLALSAYPVIQVLRIDPTKAMKR